MSELHKFLFEGLPVRGMLVRLTDSWREVLARRQSGEPFDPPVRQLLGEMACWWCGEQYQVAEKNKHLPMRGRELARVYGMSESSISAVKKRAWAQMDHWLECALERMEWAMEGAE